MLHLVPYFALGLLLLGFIAAAIYTQLNSIRLNSRGWEQLLAQAAQIDFDGIKAVAQDYLDPQLEQIRLEPQDLWNLVGGYDGMRAMRANAKLMLALAAHAQHWNFVEATIVYERMRHDALRLRAATFRIELGLIPHFVMRRFWLRTPLYLQDATAAYYLMRQRLLALYANNNSARYPRLAEVF